MPAAAALECVHCYSLVHDDLPAMDDDDLRRGLPTVHRAFDEATAILAGDALLTLAFDILAREETHPDPAVRVALIAGLARAAGTQGMVGGQMLDLAAEGRFEDAGRGRLGVNDVARLQAMKTGALLRYACEAGARLGGASARRSAQRSTPMRWRSAAPSRSPTTCSTSRATRAPSARRSARMPRPARRRSSNFSASPAPAPSLAGWLRRRKRRSRPLARVQHFLTKRRDSSPTGGIDGTRPSTRSRLVSILWVT